MKRLVGFLFLSIFLVSCGVPSPQALQGESVDFQATSGVYRPSELGQSCKRDSDCGFSEKCVSNRCYGI